MTMMLSRATNWKAKRRIGRSVVFVCLCLLGASTVYPLLFMALNSFRSTNAFEVNPFGLPISWRLSNFSTLLSTYGVGGAMLHSVIVVVPADVAATLFSALAAFVFTKTPFRGSGALFYAMLLVMLMPGVVVLIPLYVMIAHLGFANSFGPAILVYAAVSIPYGTYLMRANFRGIPDSLVEAARVDGATWGQIFRSVIVPVGRSGIVAVGVLTFLNIWNELFISIVLLHTAGTQMLTPTLAEIPGRYVTDIPVEMSGLLLAALPPVLIYLVAARVFVRGLAAGSLR